MGDKIQETIRSALVEVLKLDPSVTISTDSKLKDDLGLDSMSLLTFLMQLEEKIEGFVVDPETLEIADLETVRTVTGYVEKQIQRNEIHDE